MRTSCLISRFILPSSRTKEVFWMGLIGSWAAQVPAVFLLTKYWSNDLIGLYTGMAIGYFILTSLYSSIVLRRYDDGRHECCYRDCPHSFLVRNSA